MTAKRQQYLGLFAHLFGISPAEFDELDYEDTEQLMADADSIIAARKKGGM